MKKPSPAVVIFDVSNDHAGKLSSAQPKLKNEKKKSHGVVALYPKPSANDGIYMILIHVVVVPSFGISGLLFPVKLHLSAHHANDNVMIYVPEFVYVCTVSSNNSSGFHQSHRSTV